MGKSEVDELMISMKAQSRDCSRRNKAERKKEEVLLVILCEGSKCHSCVCKKKGGGGQNPFLHAASSSELLRQPG